MERCFQLGVEWPTELGVEWPTELGVEWPTENSKKAFLFVVVDILKNMCIHISV